MAKLDKVASNYARAIFGYLNDTAKTRALIDELRAFSDVVNSHDELAHVLNTEVFVDKKRNEVVEDLTAKLKISPDTRRILLVLSSLKRLNQTAAIAEKLHLLLLSAASVVPLKVETAVALETGERKQVEQKFNKILGKKVEATYVVDPTLIGGLRVTAGTRTYDGSLAGQLGVIEEKLIGGTV